MTRYVDDEYTAGRDSRDSEVDGLAEQICALQDDVSLLESRLNDSYYELDELWAENERLGAENKQLTRERDDARAAGDVYRRRSIAQAGTGDTIRLPDDAAEHIAAFLTSARGVMRLNAWDVVANRLVGWMRERFAGTGDTAQPGDDVIERAARTIYECLHTTDVEPWDYLIGSKRDDYLAAAEHVAAAGLLAARPAVSERPRCTHVDVQGRRCLEFRTDRHVHVYDEASSIVLHNACPPPTPTDFVRGFRQAADEILNFVNQHPFIRSAVREGTDQGSGDTEAFGTSSDCCDDPDCPCHDNDDPTGDRWADDVAAADRPPATEAKGPDDCSHTEHVSQKQIDSCLAARQEPGQGPDAPSETAPDLPREPDAPSQLGQEPGQDASADEYPEWTL